MAHITNRSPWAISVRNNPALFREFPYSRSGRVRAESYAAQLKEQGYAPVLRQRECAFQLSVRRKGYPAFHATFDCREEANKTLAQLQAESSRKIFRDYSAAMKVTFAELVQRYIVEVSPEHKGSTSEIFRLRRIVREEPFAHKMLAQLSTEDLTVFVRSRLSKVAPATADRDIDVISQVLRYADDVWKIAPAQSPLKGLRRPKYFNERDRRLRAGEEEQLLDAARADENPYIEPVIILALQTAMRRGEILGLTRDRVDFEGRAALLEHTKNGRSRKVPLTRVALEVLRALPQREDGRFFPITANTLKLAWSRRVLPAAGIVGLNFHDLRHEATSRLAESGHFSLIELQAITGHRDVRMLLRYSHLCAGKLSEKMDAAGNGGLAHEYHWHGRRRRVVVPFRSEPAGPVISPRTKGEAKTHGQR